MITEKKFLDRNKRNLLAYDKICFMRRIITILCLLVTLVFYGQSQKRSIYLEADRKHILTDQNGRTEYLILIASKDSSFKHDTYKFDISKRVDFEKYAPFDSIGKNVKELKYKILDRDGLSKYDPCELHSYLSRMRIYMVFNLDEKGFKIIPALYRGTEKNLGFIKN